MTLVIAFLAIFFALNMGGANFSASFAAAYGGGLVSRRRAKILFLLFVILGAACFGSNVSLTLSRGIVPEETVTPLAVVIIFVSAATGLFISNIFRIPQSTSLVTVAAIAGVGIHYKVLETDTILYLLPFWILLPVLSYGLTWLIAGYVYPPRRRNFWVHERLVNHHRTLRQFVLVTSCYNAFSIGSNNVANAVGPLAAMGVIEVVPGLILLGVVFGSGSFIFGGSLSTTGEHIVPLGLLSSSIICLVSGTLMIFASIFGVPQSFVMIKLAALFAIGSLKNGPELTFSDRIVKNTFFNWMLNPLITLGISYGLSLLVL